MRYYLASCTGYQITGRSGQQAGSSTDPPTSWSVLDRATAHREVAHFYVGENARRSRIAEGQARAECARRNAEERHA